MGVRPVNERLLRSLYEHGPCPLDVLELRLGPGLLTETGVYVYAGLLEERGGAYRLTRLGRQLVEAIDRARETPRLDAYERMMRGNRPPAHAF